MGCRRYVAYLCLCIAVIAGFSHGAEVVEELEVKVVENGTVDAVVLDCPYTLELDPVGLVIKWFYMDREAHFYQWIPNRDPQALGTFRDRIDLSYEASDKDLHKYRAIRILNPTTDLAGKYTCRVSTFEEVKYLKYKLVVYSKPGNVHVWAKEEGEANVKVVCEVEDIFPEPIVILRRMGEEEDDNKIILEGAKEQKSWSEGLYNMKVELIMKEDSLDGPTHFECEVTIPHTEVAVINKTQYEPRVHEVAGVVESGSDTRSAFAIVVSLAFLSLWRL